MFLPSIGVPRRLGEYFSLPEIDAALLQDVLGYVPAGLQEMLDVGSGPIYPFFQVLPMGFSWAFHLAHQAHQEIARLTLPGIPFVHDRRPAPDLVNRQVSIRAHSWFMRTTLITLGSFVMRLAKAREG